MDLASETIDFIETLIVCQGPLAGQQMRLLPWERAFIIDLLSDDVFTAALTVGRGNGKSTLTAALAVAAMVGPLTVPGAEVVVVASDFDQGRIIYHHALAFLSPWIDAEARRFSVVDTVNKAEVIDRDTRCVMKVKSSNPKSAHGLAPKLLLLDEPAQWPKNTSRKMLAALETSMGKIGEEKMVALGTRPEGGDHWFAEWLDGGADMAHKYLADKNDDPMADDTWKKANPSWHHMPSLVKAIKRDRRKAVQSADALQAFKALRLNMGVSDTFSAILISADEWARCQTDVADMTGPMVWGLDMGSSVAMSSITAYWPLARYVETMAMFPDNPDLKQRGLHDGVDDLYEKMALRGELSTTPGRTVKPDAMIREAYERWGLPLAIAGDRYKEAETLQALDDSGIPITAWIPRGQGYRDGSEDVKRFRRAVAEDLVRSKESLLLTHALGGARVAIDMSGNAKLAKHGDGTERHSRHRDDAVASLIVAVAQGHRMYRVEVMPDDEPQTVAGQPMPPREVKVERLEDDPGPIRRRRGRGRRR